MTSRVRLLAANLYCRPPVELVGSVGSAEEPDLLLADSLWELLEWLDFQRCSGNRFWAVSIGHGVFGRGGTPRPGELFGPDVWERGELRLHRPRLWRPEHIWDGSDDLLAAIKAAVEDQRD